MGAFFVIMTKGLISVCLTEYKQKFDRVAGKIYLGYLHSDAYDTNCLETFSQLLNGTQKGKLKTNFALDGLS